MVNKEEFAKRLVELMDYYELSASGLADKVGVQRSSISHLLSGRNNPSLDFIIKVLENYPDISFEWLVNGDGSIESSYFTDQSNDVAPTLFDVETEKPLKKTAKETPVVSQPTSYSKKTLLKTLLLYSDGSFEVFDKG